MIYVIGVGIAFFLSIILLTKKDKTFADKVLGTWLVVIGIHLLLFYFHNILKPFKYPQLLGIEIPLPFFHSPFLYIYAAALTKQLKNNYSWLWHFALPFLVFVSLFDFLRGSTSQKIFIFANNGQGYEEYMKVLLFALVCSSIFYVYLTNRLIKKHQYNILNQFSNQERINLRWLKYLLWGMGIIWASVFFVDNESLIFLNVVLFVIFIGYFGVNQVGVFTNKLTQLSDKIEASEDNLKKEKVSKYENSSLSIDAAKMIHENMQQKMEVEKIFKNLDLSLFELASQLDVHPNNLSQAINTYEKKSFFDYINTLRVEEFKRAITLPENQKFTLLYLAHECGFNSKTSFNRNFKKATGLSPTEYLKQINVKLDQ
jgi:AraC-like DNA-binding protein